MRRLAIIALYFICFSAFAQREGIYWVNDLHELEKRASIKKHTIEKSSRQTAGSNIDVCYYRCDWKVDPAVKFIKGEVTIYFKMLSSGNLISLDLSDSLTVLSVKNDSQTLVYTHSNDVINVILSTQHQKDDFDSVKVAYQGVPPVSNMGAFEVSLHGDNFPLVPVMWTLSEPYGSSDWWPCKNNLTDKADSIDIYITHPSNYKAVSNGLLKSEQALQGSLTKTYWKHSYPITSYLVAFAVTNYAVSSKMLAVSSDNIPFYTYSYPESQTVFEAGTSDLVAAMSLYSDLFGSYPFKSEKYAHVQFSWSGGMEHQTCSFLWNVNDVLISHELAHHWFGDKITCKSWQDVWLNEGFASFLSELYFESKYPLNVFGSRINAIEFITSLPGGSVWVDDVSDLNRIFDQRLSYAKGSHLLFMLRWILGDATFFTAVNNYINDPALAYGYATTANLKTHLEAASGRDLTYFFNQWFTGQGYPSYQVEWYPSGNSVQVKLNQTQSHASVGFFQLPVPLLFRNVGTGQQKLVVLNNTVNGQIFNDNLGFEATEVIFDPDVWLITRNNTLTKSLGPLPVVFSKFGAECRGSSARLSWLTTEEVNADYFEILASNDARNWEAIGQVQAVGNSKETNEYFFDVEAALNHNYYRIKEYDVGGKTQETRVVTADCNNGSEGIVLAPNPVKSILQVFVSDQRNAVKPVSITDVSGRKYVLNESPTVDLEGKVNLNVSHLPPGLYILVVRVGNASELRNVKFLKE